ncbi:MAG: hypothetical protein KF768_10895 [Phycisphaeraceae bacterium]|nr:hypothetical protein [Phycisphaeraceae bacterium]
MMKNVLSRVTGVVAACGLAVGVAQAGPDLAITKLLEGNQSFTFTDPDTMGEVTVMLTNFTTSTFSNPSVSDNGDWAVNLRWSSATADRAMVVNGQVVARGGGQLPQVPVDSFTYTHTFSSEPVPQLNAAGDLLVRYGAVQQPGGSATKGGLYVNQNLLEQTAPDGFPESYVFSDQVIYEPTVPAFSTYFTASGLFRINDSNQALFRTSIGPSPSRVTLHRYTYDSNYVITNFEQLMLQNEEVPGVPGRNLAAIFVTENKMGFNDDGDWAVLASFDGDANTDRAFIRNGTVLAQAGTPSIVPGRNWATGTTFSGNVGAVTLGQGSDYAFRQQIDGDTATNQVIVKNGAVLVQKGDSLPQLGAGATISSFDTDASPLFMDSQGRVYYKVVGTGTTPTNATVAIMRDDEVLIRPRVTEFAPGMFIRSLRAANGFAVSPNGRYILLLAGFTDDPNSTSLGTAGVFLIDTEPPQACPGDFNGDNVVDLADLLDFLGEWNPNLGQSVMPGTNGDVNGDGVVDLADLLDFLGEWNPNLGQMCP